MAYRAPDPERPEPVQFGFQDLREQADWWQREAHYWWVEAQHRQAEIGRLRFELKKLEHLGSGDPDKSG